MPEQIDFKICKLLACSSYEETRWWTDTHPKVPLIKLNCHRKTPWKMDVPKECPFALEQIAAKYMKELANEASPTT